MCSAPERSLSWLLLLDPTAIQSQTDLTGPDSYIRQPEDRQPLFKSFSNADVIMRAFQACSLSCLFSLCVFLPSWIKASERAGSVELMPAFLFPSSCKCHPQQLEPGQWEGSQKHIRKWKAYVSSCTTKTCTDWWVNGHFRLSSSKKVIYLRT